MVVFYLLVVIKNPEQFPERSRRESKGSVEEYLYLI
jgi:hypothetical protein